MAASLPSPNSCCTLCDGQTVVIVTTPGGGGSGGSTNALVATTLAGLRGIATSNFTAATIAYLLGNLAIYDFGPAKTYYFDPASNDADNPFSVVVPNDRQATSGRWVQIQ